MLKRIGIMLLLFMLLLGNTCLAYSIDGISLGQEKESVINVMLANGYSLVNQQESKGNLNYLFKKGDNSLLVEFNNKYVLSVYRTYPGSVSRFIERTEGLQSELGENNVLTKIKNSEIQTYGIINEDNAQLLIVVLGKKNTVIGEVLSYSN